MPNSGDPRRGVGNNEIPPTPLRRGSIDSDVNIDTPQQELPSRRIGDENWQDKYHQAASSLNSIQLSIRNNNSSTSFSRNGSSTSNNLQLAFNESYLSFIPVSNEITNDSTSSLLQTQSRQPINRRPSVFTTLSGSRFYMDDKKGEPVPFLPSNRGVVNTRQQQHDEKDIPMQDDSIRSHQLQQMHTINRHNKPPRRASNDSGAINHSRIGNASIPIMLQNISENGPPLALARREQVILSSSQHEMPRQSQNHIQHRHNPSIAPPGPIVQQPIHQNIRQPQQNLYNQNHHSMYHRSTQQLKSVIMMERIPPPIPSMSALQQQRRSNDTKMSNDCDVMFQLSTRCLQPPTQFSVSKTNNNNDKNQSPIASNTTFTVGIPMQTNESTRNRFPYHCFIMSCPQCYIPMMVSKYSIAVQCPECHTIGPSETSLSNPTSSKTKVTKKQSNVPTKH